MEAGQLSLFSGKVLIAAPHMDDEVLACGGTIAFLPQKEKIFIIFATDGTKSPTPIFPWQGKVANDLPKIRMQEAKQAMQVLGVPEKNILFFSIDDGRLKHQIKKLTSVMIKVITEIEPDHLFVPFRYDRHPDHIALTKATNKAIQVTGLNAQLYEYFIYNRYRFLPGGDIRKFIKPKLLLQIDISENSQIKKRALLCYKSQTVRVYDWQKRPILQMGRVDEVSKASEIFLKSHPDFPGAKVFEKSADWIRFIHWIEPFFKQVKEHISALVPPKKTKNVG